MLRLIPGDYLYRDKRDYAVFVANERWRDRSRDVVTEEIPIELNVFGQSTPHTVVAVVDEIDVIAEFDETNNERSVRIPLWLRGDFDDDGDVDGTDFETFSACMGGAGHH